MNLGLTGDRRQVLSLELASLYLCKLQERQPSCDQDG